MVDKFNFYHRQLLTMLENWPGQATLVKLMKDYPNLDVYIVGGAVRNVFMGWTSPPRDIDLFIQGDCTEKVLMQLTLCGRMVKGPFGSPRWYPSGSSDAYCDIVPVTAFNNGLWSCEDIFDVLNQFDFTANAIGFNLRTGHFYNPQNGVRDLECRIMRAVRFDYPEEPIAPGVSLIRPAIVWFRILHYAVKLDLRIEPVTLKWLQTSNRYLRYKEEFSKVFYPLRPECLLPIES